LLGNPNPDIFELLFLTATLTLTLTLILIFPFHNSESTAVEFEPSFGSQSVIVENYMLGTAPARMTVAMDLEVGPFPIFGS